jgi:hypothetical protein
MGMSHATDKPSRAVASLSRMHVSVTKRCEDNQRGSKRFKLISEAQSGVQRCSSAFGGQVGPQAMMPSVLFMFQSGFGA